MLRSRRLVPVMLTILMLLIGTSPILAGPPTQEIVEGTVDWVLPAGQCDAAPAGLTGSGERHQVIKTQTNPDGSTEITSNDVVKGTATDPDGSGSYHFVYINHSV